MAKVRKQLSAMVTDMRFENTQYGFNYGAAEIERCCSDEKKGWVVLTLKTKKHPQGLQIYVTKTGKVRINDGEKEFFAMVNEN